ncbi:hypothetical protein KAI87_07625 [Myxococcota bacterium]|nr:hypothetical protein [Myxococcota bacterium]
MSHPNDSVPLTHILFKPGIFILALVGVLLIALKAPLFWGIGAVGLALWQAHKLLSTPGLGQRCRLRKEKEKAGVRRILNEKEEKAVLAIDDYVSELRHLGGSTTLIAAIYEEMWGIIREAGSKDASAALQKLQRELPPLQEAEDDIPSKPDLRKRVQEELELLRASIKEVNAL